MTVNDGQAQRSRVFKVQVPAAEFPAGAFVLVAAPDGTLKKVVPNQAAAGSDLVLTFAGDPPPAGTPPAAPRHPRSPPERAMPDASPYQLDPAFVGEDVRLVVTVPGSNDTDPASGWTVLGRAWGPNGTEHASGVSAAVTDASARQVTLTVTGLTLAVGRHTVEVRRTDAGYRSVLFWGHLPVVEYRPS